MTDNVKPAFAGTCDAPCSARDRFTLDPESGFVYDRENEEWLTEPGAVFDAMWPLLPNPGHHDGAAPAPSVDGVVGSLNQEG